MGMDVFKRLASLGKRATTDVRTEVSATMGLKAGLGYPIAIDFGVGSLKILQINPGEPPSLAAAACLDTPEDLLKKHAERLQFQAQNLPRLIREGGFKGKRAVCAIPGWKTRCKNVQFAKQEGASVASLVGGAMQTQLNIDPFSMVHRHIEVQTGAMGKMEVIIVAVERDLVDRLMGAIQAAKLQPVGIQSEFDAVLRSFEHVSRRAEDKDKSTLFLDLGTTSTKASICHGPNMVFARVIEFGGRDLDVALAEKLQCSIAEARRQRMALDDRLAAGLGEGAAVIAAAPVAVGGPPEDEEGAQPERRVGRVPAGFSRDLETQERVAVAPREADIHEALEMLTDEIQMCLRYHAAQFPGRKIDRVLFVGGESRHRGLCQYIAGQLRMPAQTADPMAWVTKQGNEPCSGVDFRRPQPGWAVALGLCLSPTDL